MRIECKYYESRTYASGETVRMCRLDLAPEAPWRCPEDCKAFTPRKLDVAFAHGSLVQADAPEEPPRLDEAAIAVLDAAEDIVNAAGPTAVAEALAEREARAQRSPWWRRFRRRR